MARRALRGGFQLEFRLRRSSFLLSLPAKAGTPVLESRFRRLRVGVPPLGGFLDGFRHYPQSRRELAPTLLPVLLVKTHSGEPGGIPFAAVHGHHILGHSYLHLRGELDNVEFCRTGPCQPPRNEFSRISACGRHPVDAMTTRSVSEGILNGRSRRGMGAHGNSLPDGARQSLPAQGKVSRTCRIRIDLRSVICRVSSPAHSAAPRTSHHDRELSSRKGAKAQRRLGPRQAALRTSLRLGAFARDPRYDARLCCESLRVAIE